MMAEARKQHSERKKVKVNQPKIRKRREREEKREYGTRKTANKKE